jgi:hypothetical protein
MAMNGDTLGLAIADAVLDSSASEEGKTQCQEFWKKVANEIVSHIQQNAEVPAGITVTTTDTVPGVHSAHTGSTVAPGQVV